MFIEGLANQYALQIERGSMRRSFMDMIKGLFYSQANGSEPVHARVENARMSCTRLKALKPVDAVVQKPVEKAPAKPDLNDPRPIEKRITTLAHMSHYRLQAYVATLPVEKPEAAEQEKPIHV